MICNNCGKEFEEQAACPHCGQAVEEERFEVVAPEKIQTGEEDAAENYTIEATGKRSKKGKVAIVAVVIVLAIIAGAVGAYFLADKIGLDIFPTFAQSKLAAPAEIPEEYKDVFALAEKDSATAVEQYGTAMTVGDYDISVSEYTLTCMQLYQGLTYTVQYYQNYGYDYGFKLNALPSAQVYDSETGETWADYISEVAHTQLCEVYIMYSEAVKACTTLGEAEFQELIEYKQSIETAAKEENLSTDEYIAKRFGNGITFNIILRNVCMQQFAQAYQQSKVQEFSDSYTDEKLDAVYNESPKDFNVVCLRGAAFASAADEEEATDLVIAIKGGQTNLGETEQSFYYKTYEELSTVFSAEVADWAFDPSRAAGDCEKFSLNAGQLVLYVDRPAFAAYTVDVRHILIGFNDSMTAASGTEDADAKAKAESVFARWQEGGASEGLFVELAGEFNMDPGSKESGGLYENVEPNKMVAEFDRWCFDPKRQPGDGGIVKTTYGYHLMYFVGANTDDLLWKASYVTKASSEDYSDYYTELCNTNAYAQTANEAEITDSVTLFEKMLSSAQAK